MKYRVVLPSIGQTVVLCVNRRGNIPTISNKTLLKKTLISIYNPWKHLIKNTQQEDRPKHKKMPSIWAQDYCATVQETIIFKDCLDLSVFILYYCIRHVLHQITWLLIFPCNTVRHTRTIPQIFIQTMHWHMNNAVENLY